MRRLVSCILLLCSSALAAGCATYAQDLNRARGHYEANRYEQALALFRVLEHDLDSFSIPEQAQYAYLRGMTDYRLAGLAPQGTGVADPRKGYRDNARHWLGLAAAIEKSTPGGITREQKILLNETLTELNRDVYGGAEVLPDSSTPTAEPAPAAPVDPAAPGAPTDPLGTPAVP